MLSSACKYAINAILYLSNETSETKRKSVKEISDSLNIPFPFLAQLLQKMAKKNLISSQKGPNGGFFLTTENKALKLLIVVEEFDGLEKFNECAMGLPECNPLKPCPLHYTVDPLKSSFLNELKCNSIQEFAEKVSKGETFLSS